ncbi:ferric reductase [[Phormidium ambiguum] IAM M-71]|uniref:Ferric reductase n=1 Tax=[Phormidium ambiguum] IAM M-71 TaxID=454136 RepID=A0A1U7ITY2_9CYAN|nr:sulfite exporter TauE/SafE family protein [Phormidium ambiguum]OKH40993.1 ferric reductase [Phormidium ambiguum IAM M-71]
MLDLLLMTALGFLGSFGHCIGMCGPLSVAFSLSQKPKLGASWRQQLFFHSLLNFGRIVSYALVGATIGAFGSVLIASGQMAGIDSVLRRSIAMLTGIMLIWFGLAQVKPDFLPPIPIIHPLTQGKLHDRLSKIMLNLSFQNRWWTPAILGMVWGFIPCGFLYAAQIKAAETGNLWVGAATMLAFGLGTLPMMLGVGVSISGVSANRRSQLFRMGGWITIAIGVLTLLRTGDTMVDFTSHGALLFLMLALIARPISRIWPHPLRYRRALGVGAFVLALAHVAHILEHTLSWNVNAVSFMLPWHQLGMGMGMVALILMTPATVTSFDRFQKNLGNRWRQIHLLAVPAFLLCAIHAVVIGSHYLGSLQWSWENKLRTAILILVSVCVFLVRSRQFWSILSLEKFYAAPIKAE